MKMDSHSRVYVGTHGGEFNASGASGPSRRPARRRPAGARSSAAKMLGGLLAGTFRTANLARIKAGFLNPGDALASYRDLHGQ